MKNAVEMGSGAMIYVHTTLHKDCFWHSEVNRERFTDTHRAWKSHTPALEK
jgi:hypothetical protein